MPNEAAKKKKRTSGKAFSIDREALTLTAVMSTSSKDRDGDIVRPEGLSLKNFMKNPVVLWAHDRRSVPIAKVEETFVDPNTVMGKIKFDRNDPFSLLIFNKYADGFLNAWSIGFSSENYEPINGENGVITGFDFKESELNELSAVPVPANAEAVTRAFDGEGIDKKSAKMFVKSFDGEVRKELEAVYEAKFGKGQHTSVIDDDEPKWGSVEKTNLPEVAFAWETPGTSSEKKSSWKYPHHWIKGGSELDDMGIYNSGELFLHKGGLDAAWSLATGALTGTKAPQEVIDHLKEHRDALGLKEIKMFAVWDKDNTQGAIFEQVEDGELIKTDKQLGEGAFKKSIGERGASGKIPVSVVFAQEQKTMIEFEVIQEKENVISEVRVKSIFTALHPINSDAAPSQEESGRSDTVVEGEEANEPIEAIGKSLVELEESIMNLDVRITNLNLK